MKNSTIHAASASSRPFSLSLLMTAAALFLRDQVLVPLSRLFSDVLEEDVTPWQTLCIVHACLALCVLLCSAAVSLPFSALCTAWFLIALRQCKRAGLDGDD